MTNKKITFCINLPKKKKDRKNLDSHLVREIIVPWRSRRKLPDFMAMYPKIRFTLDCPQNPLNEEDTKLLADFAETVPLRFDTPQKAEVFFKNNRKVTNKFYCAAPAISINDIERYISMGVISVGVAGALLLSHDDLLPFASMVELRCSPILSAEDKLESCFIRPEDIDLYEDVFKMIDFSHVNNTPIEKTLTKIYFSGEWFFDLEMLGPHMPRANNCLIYNEFGSRRMNCKLACITENKSCNFCSTVAAIAEKMKDVLEEKDV